jgi:hypothetical protein
LRTSYGIEKKAAKSLLMGYALIRVSMRLFTSDLFMHAREIHAWKFRSRAPQAGEGH